MSSRRWLVGLLAGAATVFAMAGAAAGPAPARIQAAGFSVAAPVGAGWKVVRQRRDAIVFVDNAAAARVGADGEPYAVLAGTVVVDTGKPLPAVEPEAALLEWARDLLVARLADHGHDLAGLEAQVASLGGARCVQYRATQVDRFAPDSVAPRFEVSHQGYLCVPAGGAAPVQAFVTERYLRARGAPALRAPVEEGLAAIRSLTFAQP
ncbi:hypothetical protein [Cupriavidus sp. PET2-C1]